MVSSSDDARSLASSYETHSDSSDSEEFVEYIDWLENAHFNQSQISSKASPLSSTQTAPYSQSFKTACSRSRMNLLSDDEETFSITEDSESESDEDSEMFSEDEDMILDDDDDEEEDAEEPEPFRNILMNFPSMNMHNPLYVKALTQYLQCFGLSPDSDEFGSGFLKIKTPTIDIPIRDPFNSGRTITIRAAADTCSGIQCFGPKNYLIFKAAKKVKYHKEGTAVMTGNGRIVCHEYVPLLLKRKNGAYYQTIFWYLPNLPKPFDWLVGNDLLNRLGWQLTNRFAEYEHKPVNLDAIDDELDDPTCCNYPLFDQEPKLDISSIKVPIAELREFVHQQIESHQHLIADHEWDSGEISKADGSTEYGIDFIDEPHEYKDGFLSKEYFMKFIAKEEVRRQILGMLKHKVISICRKPKYVSSLFCREKKTGDIRIVFDYRKLNLITKKIHYPIPNMEELLEKFKGKDIVTSLDMKGGYWHIPIKAEDKYKTAFIFDGQIYQWNVLPFGPCNAPMFFQQIMNRIFGDLPYVVVYLDDISIMSESVAEHKEHLKEVFRRLNEHRIKLRIDKCIWGVSQTEYLGFIVDKDGVSTKASYVKKILDLPEPRSKKSLLRYLGLCQFLHRFIPQMQYPCSILSRMLHNDQPNRFTMTERQRNAFFKLKELVSNTNHMRHPDATQEFHVFTDASQIGLGGMLAQWSPEHNQYQPVAYCSKVFSQTQQRWHVSEQELYAAIYCIEKWGRLLHGNKFILHTDHKNLEILFAKAKDFKSGKLFRWAVRLQDYHFECHYIKGSDNTIADWLSRESCLLQQSQYKEIKKFYDAVPEKNEVRAELSENGGVDILALYTHHLVLSTVNEHTIFRGHDHDPFDEVQNGSILFPLRSDHPEKSVSVNPSEHDLLSQCSPSPYVVPSSIPIKKKTRPQRACKAKGVSKRRRLLGIPDNDYDQTRHQQLNVRPLKRYKLGTDERHDERQTERNEFKLRNQQIIDSKPFEVAWNRDILDPRFTDPIREDYEEVILNGSNSHSRKWLRAKQSQDWMCAIIINFLKQGTNALFPTLPEYIQRLVLSGRFRINTQNILCWSQTFVIKDEDGNKLRKEERLLKVAPSVYRKSLMKLTHQKVHHGRSKMTYSIQVKYGFWWPKMRYDTALWCQSCNTCQHIKDGGYKRHCGTTPYVGIWK